MTGKYYKIGTRGTREDYYYTIDNRSFIWYSNKWMLFHHDWKATEKFLATFKSPYREVPRLEVLVVLGKEAVNEQNNIL